jgi:hypothetical protein
MVFVCGRRGLELGGIGDQAAGHQDGAQGRVEAGYREGHYDADKHQQANQSLFFPISGCGFIVMFMGFMMRGHNCTTSSE